MSENSADAPTPSSLETPLARSAAVAVPGADALAGRFPLTPGADAVDVSAEVSPITGRTPAGRGAWGG